MPTNHPTAPAPGRLDCACANLRRAARAVTQLYDGALRPMGLRATQFTLLQVLGRRGAVTQAALGEFLAIDSTTLSRTVRLLERVGWVRRAPGDDRRERHLELTPSGRRVLARATPAWERAQRRLRDRVGVRHWLALQDLLETMAGAARR